MNNWPTDPIRQHNRFIAALCDDWLETGVLSLGGPKASRVAEINRQISRERGRSNASPVSNGK